MSLLKLNVDDVESITPLISNNIYIENKPITFSETYDTYKTDILTHTSLISDIVDIIINYINKTITYELLHVQKYGVRLSCNLYWIKIVFKACIFKLIRLNREFATHSIPSPFIEIPISDIYDIRKHNYEIRETIKISDQTLYIHNHDQYNDMLAVCKLMYDLLDDIL